MNPRSRSRRVRLARLARVAVLLALAALPLAGPAAARAEGWVFPVKELPTNPSRLLVVDKRSQTFFYFQQHSPLALVHKLPCATGQADGDKTKEGDLRTPVGVYFLGRKLEKGLDYDLYGDLAYTLNFPNPVDVINGKTGHGIWIHGRGKDINTRETKGCVALNSPDLKRLDQYMQAGMPVVIADQAEWPAAGAAEHEAVSRQLVDQTRTLLAAWQDKNEKAFFDLLDEDRLALSEGRQAMNPKERRRALFERFAWIRLTHGEVKALAGPDYWVTWFGQYFRAPSFASEGVKRLYWQRDDQGRWRVTGMEWAPETFGLEKTYQEQVTAEVRAWLDDWRAAWEKGDMARYLACYDDTAAQGDRKGLDAIQEQKKALWAVKRPKRVDLDEVAVGLHPLGVQVRFRQSYLSADGSGDVGRKTLILRPRGQGWAVLKEDWSGS